MDADVIREYERVSKGMRGMEEMAVLREAGLYGSRMDSEQVSVGGGIGWGIGSDCGRLTDEQIEEMEGLAQRDLKLPPPGVKPPYGARSRRAADDVLRLIREVRASRERERAYREAIKIVRAAYPESVFPPDSESMDAKSAAWARMVCDNIEMTAEQYMEGGVDG